MKFESCVKIHLKYEKQKTLFLNQFNRKKNQIKLNLEQSTNTDEIAEKVRLLSASQFKGRESL